MRPSPSSSAISRSTIASVARRSASFTYMNSMPIPAGDPGVASAGLTIHFTRPRSRSGSGKPRMVSAKMNSVVTSSGRSVRMNVPPLEMLRV